MGQPFGEELPENFGSPAAEPNTSPDGASTSGVAGEAAAAKAENREPQVTDLDSLEKFRFQGRELNKQELMDLVQRAQNPEPEASKFDKAFRIDLDVVLKDPSRLTDFKSIYPPEYVQIVERLLSQARGVQTAGQPQGHSSDAGPKDPRLDEIFSTVQEWKTTQKEQRIESYTRQLDASFDKLSKKFPEADPEVINSRCLALSQQGIQLLDAKGNVREAVIEKLFKQDHDKRSAYYEQKYRAKVEAQKSANSRSRDMATGGTASSPQGKTARTIKEATAMAMQDLQNAR